LPPRRFAVDARRGSNCLPKALRWAVLKNADGPLTDRQADALAELQACGHATGEAWRIKEKLRWVRKAETAQAARWRLTHFLRHARDIIADTDLLKPMLGALATVEKHAGRILERWSSGYSTARLEGLNGLFQAARARARGYRNAATFAAMIYLIGAPIHVFVST